MPVSANIYISNSNLTLLVLTPGITAVDVTTEGSHIIYCLYYAAARFHLPSQAINYTDTDNKKITN